MIVEHRNNGQFIKNVIKIMNAYNLSKYVFSKAFKPSSPNIYHWITGSKPALPTLLFFSYATGYSVIDLLTTTIELIKKQIKIPEDKELHTKIEYNALT